MTDTASWWTTEGFRGALGKAASVVRSVFSACLPSAADQAKATARENATSQENATSRAADVRWLADEPALPGGRLEVRMSPDPDDGSKFRCSHRDRNVITRTVQQSRPQTTRQFYDDLPLNYRIPTFYHMIQTGDRTLQPPSWANPIGPEYRDGVRFTPTDQENLPKVTYGKRTYRLVPVLGVRSGLDGTRCYSAEMMWTLPDEKEGSIPIPIPIHDTEVVRQLNSEAGLGVRTSFNLNREFAAQVHKHLSNTKGPEWNKAIDVMLSSIRNPKAGGTEVTSVPKTDPGEKLTPEGTGFSSAESAASTPIPTPPTETSQIEVGDKETGTEPSP